MPTSKIYELFGYPTDDKTPSVEASRKACRCPFTDARCDGGGNRHQTTINLANHPSLARYFNPGISKVVPGVCSIQSSTGAWIVCPRRLLGVKHDGQGRPPVNQSLQAHERTLLLDAGIPRNMEVGIWSEVYLKFADSVLSDAPEDEVDSNGLIADEEAENAIVDSDINYHFDYIAAELEYLTLDQITAKYNGDEEDLKALKKLAKQIAKHQGLASTANAKTLPLWVPNLNAPFFILEVMTASTSGSNKTKGTNISSAFTNAILGIDHESPGINKRQVWARMTSQLFAKSALAQEWGGKTVWIVQDELLRYIELTTRLQTKTIPPNPHESINFIAMCYDPTTKAVALNRSYQGAAGVTFQGRSNAYTDILLPKTIPGKIELMKAILRRPLAGIVNL